MGQFSMEILLLTGSLLSGNQHSARSVSGFCRFRYLGASSSNTTDFRAPRFLTYFVTMKQVHQPVVCIGMG